MNDPLDSLDPEAETDYDREQDSDARFPLRYDDVYDGDGNLVKPASVLEDPFVS